MRVLAFETSTRRGSVAVSDGAGRVHSLWHDKPSAHGEELLPLVGRLLDEAGVAKSSLERIAAGVGPGSFTGTRIGIALAEGIALALGVEIVGVGSLRAMAHAALGRERNVVSVLDARRGEVFVAVYAPDGAELLPPAALAPERAREAVLAVAPASELLGVGEALELLGPGIERLSGELFDLPHARLVAEIGATLDPRSAGTEPVYVRGPGATLPDLPPSPFSNPEPAR